MLLRSRGTSFRTRIAALAGAAVLPWPVAAAVGAAGPVPVAAAALVSLTVIAILFLQLRPLAEAARSLRALADDAPGTGVADEVGAIRAATQALEERLASLHHRWSQRHPLTELPTRELLLAEIDRDIADGAPETLLGVIRFRDFDRLQAFDAAQADVALQAFAAVLTAAVGRKRPLAQVDRDCFAIWFRGAVPAAAETELRALCYAMSGEIAAGDLALVPEVEASAGVYPTDGADPAGLLTRTLISFERKLRPSGDRVQLLAPRPAHAAREHFSLEQGLRQAVSRDQLELHFQPVVDLAQGRMVGAEALIRWRHPDAGLIAPDRFVPIIEDAHLTEEIGMWTLNAACRAARSWREAGVEGLSVAVNLSAHQLRNPKLARVVGRTLERHGLPPKTLELELTETAAMEDTERTFRLFSALREMGVSMVIDDFGSGYSSLSYVKNLPFDKLKIDREFVIDVDQRPDSQAICRTLIELARGLGIRLLAEGVETAEEVALLRAIGCTLFQGFFFAKPLPETTFLEKASDADWQRRIADPDAPTLEDENQRMIA